MEPSAALRQRTQTPRESDLTYFDFDRDSSIIKSLTGIHEAIVDRELFDKVQAKLAEQNPRADCNRHPSQGLLQGLIFDANSRAYSPVCHVRRGRKPYKYYVSQKAMRDGYDGVVVKNVKIDDVDSLVLKRVKEQLPKGWDHKTFNEKRVVLRQIIEKVVLHEDRIDLILKTENGPELKSISVQFQKIGQKKLMLDVEGKDIVPHRANKDSALIKALVRAYKWERTLETDNKSSLRSIAKAEDLEQKYVTQIYRLIFLSPRIKEAILDGIQPQALTLSRLMQGVPLGWQEQERLYGF